MPDPGLSRASEDAGSLAVPSTRAIGPYVGGAACRFVASRWPWRLRLLAGPGSRIPSCCPSVQPERAWGASRSAGDTRLHGPPSTSALSCTHASQWNFDRQRPSAGRPTRTRERAGARGDARRCALKCAMCALHAAFYMLQAACCIYTLRVAICALHGRMLRAALYMAAWCTPRACVRPIYDETAHEAHRCRATTAQPRCEILIIQSGPVPAVTAAASAAVRHSFLRGRSSV